MLIPNFLNVLWFIYNTYTHYIIKLALPSKLPLSFFLSQSLSLSLNRTLNPFSLATIPYFPFSFFCLSLLGQEKLDFDVKFIHNTAINPYFMCSKPLTSDKNDTGGGNQDFGKKFSAWWYIASLFIDVYTYSQLLPPKFIPRCQLWPLF